jgi:hypothetical protein
VLTLLILAITQGWQWSWSSAATIGVFAASAAPLAAFALRRQREPLGPFSIFRLRRLAAANVAGLVLGTALFSMFLMLTLYTQHVVETGFGYVAVTGTAVVWANLGAAAVNRVGWHQADTDRRDEPAHYRPSALHRGAGRRLVLGRPSPGFPCARRGHPVSVRADHNRGTRRDETAGSRPIACDGR